MIMPSHAKNVKHYQEALPLFARYQVESYLGGMFNPTVQLKSGGYIVIGVTEALVAIDVNSGRATKEASIEETALKTNLEAAEEVARQLRLRDLAGLIVIDFIDMDERKNNAAVEKRMKDKLKTDRARIQVGRISGFGLMEMSRQRLRPGMIEATTQPCPHCHGTGLIRSDDSMALQILRQIEEEGTRRRSREVLVKCPVDIANYLMNQKREHIAQIETRYGLSVRVEGDVKLVSPDFTFEKFKTATRNIPAPSEAVVSADMSLMDEIDADDSDVDVIEAEAVEVSQPAETTEDEGEKKGKRRRRRRRRRKGNGEEGTSETGQAEAKEAEAENFPRNGAENVETGDNPEADETKPDSEEVEAKPKKRTRTRRRKKTNKMDESAAALENGTEAPADTLDEGTVDASSGTAEETAGVAKQEEAVVSDESKPEATQESAEPTVEFAEPAAEEATASDEMMTEDPSETPATLAVMDDTSESEISPKEEVVSDEAEEDSSEEFAVAEVSTESAQISTPTSDPVVAATSEPEEPPKPKRKGWWSVGR